jgi:acyl carrier protein
MAKPIEQRQVCQYPLSPSSSHYPSGMAVKVSSNRCFAISSWLFAAIPVAPCAAIRAEPSLKGTSYMNAVSQRVKAIVAYYLDVPSELVLENSSLIDDLGADSLGVVEIVLAIEEEFGLDVDDEKADKISTVGDAIRYIEEVRTLRA